MLRPRKTESGLELGIPVRDVDRVQERPPLAIAPQAERGRDERRPVRAHGLLQQLHARLLGGPTTLSPIAAMARADDVLPRGEAALGSRHDVVEIQVGALEVLAAVLTRV